ncbi:Thiaminase [Mariprofundus ferrinatatus]|uniref:Thiaminase n=1 Tax=Mariprofundus ferrinatatus TaxID=1921087 RepID=A0A2K8L4K2_9PROT|nr:iron-containing redox enzyme family protein [Mariprofundus ferrinatatus]ATX82255.1 Thiaminase [Mariprofundus ferrinatatus]
MAFYDDLIASTEVERNDLLSIPFIQMGAAGKLSLESYIAFLTQAYHHVKHTTPLLMATGGRLPGRLEWLRDAVAEYIEEELGHQEWILNDIEACGGDKEAVRHGTPAVATELMVAYAYDTVYRINPAGFFGMVLVLEGTSVSLATHAAGNIEKSLGLPKKAFSYLNSHGSLDVGHVDFYEKLMNRLDSDEDKKAVIHCAKVFYKLYGDIFRSLPLIPLGDK